jgi:hypothetical protein
MVDGAPAAISLKLSFTETSALNRKKYNEAVSAYTNQGSSDRETYQDTFKGVIKKNDATAIVQQEKTKRAREAAKKQAEAKSSESEAPVTEE